MSLNRFSEIYEVFEKIKESKPKSITLKQVTENAIMVIGEVDNKKYSVFIERQIQSFLKSINSFNVIDIYLVHSVSDSNSFQNSPIEFQDVVTFIKEIQQIIK